MAERERFSSYLINFFLWLALFALLHYTFFPTYAGLLVTLTERALEFIHGSADFQLGVVPNPEGVFGGKGFALLAQGLPRPFLYPHNLYSVTLNFIFVPALVLTTLGTAFSAWVKALIAAALMLLLHTLHVLTIVLYFPLTQAPIPNPVISAEFPAWLAAFVRWNYGFTDKMGYTLFPFLAWVSVCFTAIVGLLNRFAEQQKPVLDTAAQDKTDTGVS